jgi:hypothetical protein
MYIITMFAAKVKGANEDFSKKNQEITVSTASGRPHSCRHGGFQVVSVLRHGVAVYIKIASDIAVVIVAWDVKLLSEGVGSG